MISKLLCVLGIIGLLLVAGCTATDERHEITVKDKFINPGKYPDYYIVDTDNLVYHMTASAISEGEMINVYNNIKIGSHYNMLVYGGKYNDNMTWPYMYIMREDADTIR